MDSKLLAALIQQGGHLVSALVKMRPVQSQPPELPELTEESEEIPEKSAKSEQIPEPQAKTETSQEKQDKSQDIPAVSENIATACVPCAIGHYSGASRLLHEALRFKDEGMESEQIADDIAGAIGELNAMERVDLTPGRLAQTPKWEKEIAEDALRRSRQIRHQLEKVTSIAELEQIAADTENYYKLLHRQWYKGRFQHLEPEKVEAITKRVGQEEQA